MQCRFLLYIVVRQSAIILQLLTGKDQALLIGRNSLLILNLRLDILNRIRRLTVKSDRLSSQSFDEDLHLYVIIVGYSLDLCATQTKKVTAPCLNSRRQIR